MTGYEAAGDTVNPEIAQTERIGLGDLIIAGALALLTLVISILWQFPALSPSVWNDAVVAAGVRPASAVVPGYWRCAGSIVFDWFGIHAGGEGLKLLGHVSLMLIAISVYATFREILAFMMRARPQFSKRRTIVMQLASAVGAVAFVCSDAVWSAGQSFSESMVLILLTISALEFYFVFLRKGALKYAYCCSALLGLLAAESPVGLVLSLVFIGIYSFILKVMPVLESPFFKPAVIAVGKWRMTFFFMAALCFGVALNCYTYASHNGLASVGAAAGDVPLAYLKGYWSTVVSAADALGWLLIIGVALAPFVVTLVRFPSAADEEQFLSYPTGVVFLVCGIIAVAQSCALPSLWYWTYGEIYSQFLLSLGSLLSAVTLAGAVTILGVDALCRNHRRLAVQVFGSDDDDREDDDEGVADSGSVKALRMLGLVLVPTVIVLAIVPGRKKSYTREMLSIIKDSVAAIVDEARDSEYIFTDGNLDAAIELESALRGGDLKCVSLLGGNDPMSGYLRLRGLGNDKEDRFSFRIDGGMGLRTWMRDKPERLARSSVQIGFDLWRRDGKAIPEMGGFLSRPLTKIDPAERQRFIERSYQIAQRILSIHRCGGFQHCTDKSITAAVKAIQWRIARMCFYRAQTADLAKQTESAIADEELAKELNDCNPDYQELIKTLERHNEQLLSRLTPREGLQLALVRADFTMAKLYAETILVASPAHPDANFAMGMYYQKQQQLSRAEEYLKRSLVGKPNEPSVYNNLAMVQMEMGKLEAALVNVEKALKLIPDSTAVLDTRQQILRRQSESRESNNKEKK